MYVTLILFLYAAVAAAKKSRNPRTDGCSGVLLERWVFQNSTCAHMHGSQAMCLMYNPEFSLTFMNCWDRISQNATKAERAADYELLEKTAAKSKVPMNVLTDALERSKTLTTPAPPYNSNVTEPFLLSDNDIMGGYHTILSLKRVRPLAYKWSALPSAWWAFVFALRILYYNASVFLAKPAHIVFNSVLFRKFNAYFAIPALFRRSHSEPALWGRYFTFNFPTRGMSFIVVVYFILGIFISCWPLPMIPKQYYNFHFGDRITEYCRYLGIQSGQVCIQQFPFLWIFGARNNFLMWITGWSMDTFNVFHKAAGRVTTLMILIHTLAYTIEFSLEKRYTKMWPGDMGWKTAIVAFFFMVFNCFFGVHWFRKLNYEWFLVLHIAGALLVLVPSYYHVKLYNGGSLIAYYVTSGLWLFDRVARVARIVISGPFSKAHIVAHEDDTLELTVNYSGLWKPYPGSHVYIHFVNTWFFLESHPFSIVNGVGSEEGKLKFFVRVGKGITRRIQKKVMANGGVLDTHVWVDGPYGPRLPVNKFKEILLISGGVGVSATYSHAQKLMTEMPESTPIDLYWAVPDEIPHTSWFKEELEHIVSTGRVRVHIFISHSARHRRFDIENGPSKIQDVCERLGDAAEKEKPLDQTSSSAASENDSHKLRDFSGERKLSSIPSEAGLNIHHASMDINEIVTSHVSTCRGDMAVVVCGPGTLNDAARKAVALNFQTTSHYVEYFEESFSW